VTSQSAEYGAPLPPGSGGALPLPSHLPDNAQSWLKAPNTRRLWEILGEDRARFVGGCVRDALLGRLVGDLDLACLDPPEVTTHRLEKAGVRVIPTGLSHGTITAIIGKQTFEITTLRRDISTDGRRAHVRYTQDWAEDAARRDLTMNALYADAQGRLYDPLGTGLADTLQGQVRFVGEAARRLKEDILRLLRFFRFYAYYGQKPLLEKDIKAAYAAAPRLSQLSGERLWQELQRLLAAPHLLCAFAYMQEGGVLTALLPFMWQDTASLAHFIEQEQAVGLTPDALRRLAAILHPLRPQLPGQDIPQHIALAQISRRLRFSSREQLRFNRWCTAPKLTPGFLARYYVAYGGVGMIDLLLRDGWAPTQIKQALALSLKPVPTLPIKAADLLAQGYEPGRCLGQAMQALKEAWLDSDTQLGREALLAMAQDKLFEAKKH
jgi:poly(A) polymerase